MTKNNGSGEPLLPQNAAPPFQPDGDERTPAEPLPRVMLNEKQVLAIVPVSTVTLWRMERDGIFPKGSYISANRKVWFADEIVAWQNSVNGRARGRRPRKT
jgi:predicted DNA-binding transcriptional regulator AlpA